VTDDPWSEGLRHDEHRAEREAARALQWSVALEPQGRGLALSVRDAAGRPLDGLDARIEARRADTTEFDRALALRSVGEGRYVADDALVADGLYELQIRIVGAQGTWVGERQKMIRSTEGT
jgi:nitrogen fixation protein FixH